MKIKSTLAPLAGFTLVGFLWAGEATAQHWPGSRRRRSFRRPSLRRLCQSAEPQSLDEPPKWRRRKHAAPLPPNREAPPAGCSDPAARLEVRRGRAGDPPEKSSARTHNPAAERSGRAELPVESSDLAEARAGSSAAAARGDRSVPAAGLAASGRAGRAEASALEAKVGSSAREAKVEAASGRGRRRRQPAAGRRGRGEPARRVVRPALRLPRNARPRRAARRSTPWYTPERTAESRQSARWSRRRRQSARRNW